MNIPSKQISKKALESGAIFIFEITKKEVLGNNFNHINELMLQLKTFGKIARQKILFSFSGYENDKDLLLIPEVVLYTQALLDQHPYFWYYAMIESSTFFTTAQVIDTKNYTAAANMKTSTTSVQVDAMKTLLLLKKMEDDMLAYGIKIDDLEGARDSLEKWSTSFLEQLKGAM